MRNKVALQVDQIGLLIRTIRGQKVILDTALARIFGVPTFRFNEAIKRNRERFPDVLFQLTLEEFKSLISQFAILKKGRGQHRKYLPYAFTENGSIMAANVLNSPQAVRMSVFVVRAFVQMRDLLGSTKELAEKLTQLEKRLTSRLDEHEVAIVEVLRRVMDILDPPPLPDPPAKSVFTSASRNKNPKANQRRRREFGRCRDTFAAMQLNTNARNQDDATETGNWHAFAICWRAFASRSVPH